MSYKVVISNKAKEDFNVAKEYYKSLQIKGLRSRFTKSVTDVLLNKLTIYPTAFAVRYKNVRISYTTTFPYAIYFTVDEVNKEVTVIAIVHIRRLRKEE